MSGFLAAVEAVRHLIAGALVAVGALGLGASLVGQIRFPDFFTRVQAASLMPLAAGGLLVGLAVEAWDLQLGMRLALLALLLIMLGPIRTHLMAGAAHAAGLAPLVGRLGALADRVRPQIPRPEKSRREASSRGASGRENSPPETTDPETVRLDLRRPGTPP